MADIPPLEFHWDGEAMVPNRPKVADRYYTVGENYSLVPHEVRSMESHRHYFACINDAWRNLPEDIADDYATSEHLRKAALIEAGYYDEAAMACSSKAEALRLAAFIRPMDDFAKVIVRGNVVARRTAKSQSMRAMGAKDFQASKTAVLDILAAMTGVTTQELEMHAGKAA